MPFWDKSDPEDIRERFNMSKAAFKRALGHLMKQDKIYQEEGLDVREKIILRRRSDRDAAGFLQVMRLL